MSKNFSVFSLNFYTVQDIKPKTYMQLILSMIFIVASFVGAFLLAGGSPRSLLQPFEFMMIGGSCIGFLFASNTIPAIKKMGKYFKFCLNAPYSKEKFLELFTLLFELATLSKKSILDFGDAIAEPETSEIFKKYPLVHADKDAVNFLCSNLTLHTDSISTMTEYSFDEHLESEIEQYEKEAQGPYKTMNMLVDTAPALGICAAVLGILLSMSYLDAPMEELGKHIGAALFGTFLGVFMAYGLFKPIAMKFSKFGDESTDCLRVIKAFIMGLQKGYSPAVACIIANKMTPPRYRTPDVILKKAIRGKAPE